MRKGHDIISMDKNRFPGAVAFVETFDTDDDVAEQANILSFESLREAFVRLRTAEAEIAKAMPEIELQTEHNLAISEHPDYEIDTVVVSEDDDVTSIVGTENPVVVSTQLESVIEAVLFVGNQKNCTLNTDQIVEKLRNVSVEDVAHAVIVLNEHYRERNSPYTIISESDGYRMVLRPEFEPVRDNFFGKVREYRLPQQAIDTLAVVAYRQPITAEEVQSIRQQPCSAVLNQLVRRNLLKINREVQDKKNVIRYRTTTRFLDLCQIKSLDDLPRADELDYQ